MCSVGCYIKAKLASFEAQRNGAKLYATSSQQTAAVPVHGGQVTAVYSTNFNYHSAAITWPIADGGGQVKFQI